MLEIKEVWCDSSALGQMNKVRFQSAVALFVFNGMFRKAGYLVETYRE